MFNLKKIFTKSAFVGLAITLSLGTQISHTMEQDPGQDNPMRNNSTASKKEGEFQVDKILSDVEHITDDAYYTVTQEYLPMIDRKIKALHEEKEFIELTSFLIKKIPGFDLNKFFENLHPQISLYEKTKFGLRGSQLMGLRAEKELCELRPFFNNVPGFDLNKFFADFRAPSGTSSAKPGIDSDKLGVWGCRVESLKKEKELFELTSFHIIHELKNDLIPAIMLFNSFLGEQKTFNDVRNIIIHKLLFLRLGTRFICPPTK